MKMNELRKKIDSIDERLVSMLSQRARLTQKIGLLKSKSNTSVYAPHREKQVFESICKHNKGPLSNESLIAVYREIMSGSLNLEKKPIIAYLGPEYTFTHQVSMRKFGQSVDYESCQSISEVFAEVENGRSTYGVAPVENSTEGAISFTLDEFMDSNLKICAEIQMKIKLDLLSKEKNLSDIRKVYSNPAVFGQCRRWFSEHLSGAEWVDASSTAASAKIARNEKGSACIASEIVSTGSGLKVLAKSIQDSRENTTRFLVLAQEDSAPTKSDKTTVMISLKDKPGSLQKVLEPFRKSRINLTKIESRPSKRRKWSYVFFIDFVGHRSDAKVKRVLKLIDQEADQLKILGSYPIAT